MRPIKFRVWHINSFETGFHINNEGKLCSWDHSGCEEIEDFNDLIIEQFTGLQDKNGNDIYEGDILKMFSKIECVEFSKGEQSYWNGDLFSYSGFVIDDELKYVEIIGNIHSNPELLEKK